MTLNSFLFLHKIGQGSFGKVYKAKVSEEGAKNSLGNEFYAIKVIRKDLIVKLKAFETITNEIKSL